MLNMLNAAFNTSLLASVHRLTQTSESLVYHFYLKPLTITYFLDLKAVQCFLVLFGAECLFKQNVQEK